MSVKEKLKKLKDVNILVVGDIMLDRYIVGEVKRISPEAPVPVVHVNNTYHTLGGSGNVIRNLRELGVNVTCCARIGNDQNGALIIDELNKSKVNSKVVVDVEYPTITKTRVIAGERQVQMLRIDEEEISCKKDDLVYNSLHYLYKNETFNMIIVSDYAKGFVTFEVMEKIRKFGVPIIVDPKPSNNILYHDVFMLTPNEEEYNIMSLMSSAILGKNIPYILKTMGRKGMDLINKNNEKIYIPTTPLDVYNVSGAGDTVIAVVATCLSIGLDVEHSARVANKCAGYVVTKPGTTVIPKTKFKLYVLRSEQKKHGSR
jgi:rfaE bifunctional protein kinase chain/domain